jgi:hypothetical protein
MLEMFKKKAPKVKTDGASALGDKA